MFDNPLSDTPSCPICSTRSGRVQCVNCGCNYEGHKKREADREKKRIAALVPLSIGWLAVGKIQVLGRDIRGASYSLLDVDLTKKGSRHWKKVFKKIRSFEEEGFLNTIQIIEDIKLRRYHYRIRPKEHRVSKDIRIWAHTVIQIEMEGHYCVDNIRFARYSNRAATRRYFKQKRDGCCGSFDIIKRCPFDWFRKYRIGCNYGH